MKPATALLVVTLLVIPLSASADADQPGGSFLDDDASVQEADIEAIALKGITKGATRPPTSCSAPTRK